MKKFLLIIITISLITHVSYAHWADGQIESLRAQGVLQKVFFEDLTDEVLKRPITREEFFTLTAVTNNTAKNEMDTVFVDCEEVNSKFSLYIGGMINSGVIQGIPEEDGIYIKPKQQITRQEATVILSKMLGLTDENFEIGFEDNDTIAKWAVPYLKGVIKAGIINGYPDNTVRPKNNITLAEAIVIVGNTYNLGYFSKEKITVFAGTGEKMLVNGLREAATFTSPLGIALRDEKIYVADTGNNAIRCIDSELVSTFAGGNVERDEFNEAIGSFKDGTNASFDGPAYLIALENGILLTDKKNNLIRFISNEGYTTTLAGSIEKGLVNGKTDVAKFNEPSGIAIDSMGNIYIADTGNSAIRKIDTARNVTTLCGCNSNGGYKDGELGIAEFNRPMGITIVNDVLFVADTGNQRIRMIKDGIASTYAGIGEEKDDYGNEILGGYSDGNASTARFNFPVNIVSDDAGNLFVADTGNGAIRKIDLTGNVTTLVNEVIKRPAGILIKENELYVSDTLLNRIFKVRILVSGR